jgi:hypothetical protein
MNYRITKDCGTGWDDALKYQNQATTWGVSDNQKLLAEKVAHGDIFLHYIDHAHAWAGYSNVSGALRASDEFGDALPYAIPIEPVVWLNKDQCEHTIAVIGLPTKHYERQRAFTSISSDEASLIIEAIKSAVVYQSKQNVTFDFDKNWKAEAESYYKGIVKGTSRGKCRMCGEDAESWIGRIPIKATEEEVARMNKAFLDAAHIVPIQQNGPMTPENLRALCPNCHRIVDRLSLERREKLLR